MRPIPPEFADQCDEEHSRFTDFAGLSDSTPATTRTGPGPATVSVWTRRPESTMTDPDRDPVHSCEGCGGDCNAAVFHGIGALTLDPDNLFPTAPCHSLPDNQTMWHVQVDDAEGCNLFFYADELCISTAGENWASKAWAYLGQLAAVSTDTCIGPSTTLSLVTFLNEAQLTAGFRGFQIMCPN